jgi:hypothetical protein
MRNILIPGNKVNIPALAAGILILYILYTNEPWWTLTAVGENPTFKALVAPYRIEIEIMGKPVDSPIIHYITLSGTISYLLIGLSSIAAAFLPQKPWSKSLIGYRAITMIIFTVATLYISLYTIKNMLGITLPLIGMAETTFKLPYETGTINIYTPVEAYFTQTFYLALIAAILAAIARTLTGKEEEEE